MRRISSIALLLLILAAHSGISLKLHYCNGHLESVNLAGAEETTCCGVKMVVPPGCCSTDTVVLECEDDHLPVFQTVELVTPALIHAGWAALAPVLPENQTAGVLRGRAPPEPSGPPLYLRHQQLITYG